jgi:hypothetical protein
MDLGLAIDTRRPKQYALRIGFGMPAELCEFGDVQQFCLHEHATS